MKFKVRSANKQRKQERIMEQVGRGGSEAEAPFSRACLQLWRDTHMLCTRKWEFISKYPCLVSISTRLQQCWQSRCKGKCAECRGYLLFPLSPWHPSSCLFSLVPDELLGGQLDSPDAELKKLKWDHRKLPIQFSVTIYFRSTAELLQRQLACCKLKIMLKKLHFFVLNEKTPLNILAYY